MKFLIILFVILGAFFAVKCDKATEIKEIIAKVSKEIMALNEQQLKARSTANVEAIVKLMKDASDVYRKTDLALVADVYDEIEVFVTAGLKEMFNYTDAADVKDRMTILVELTIILEVIKEEGGMEKTLREKMGEIKATDTEANLSKKYHELTKETLDLLKWVVTELRKVKDDKVKAFWADVHEKIELFMEPGLKMLDDDLLKLTDASVRAKNEQLMIYDLTLLLAIADTRNAKNSTTIEAFGASMKSAYTDFKVKVSEFGTKVKSFFAKINPF